MVSGGTQIHHPTLLSISLSLSRSLSKCSVFRKQKSTHTFPSSPSPLYSSFHFHSYFIFNILLWKFQKGRRLYTTDAAAAASDASDATPATVIVYFLPGRDFLSFFLKLLTHTHTHKVRESE